MALMAQYAASKIIVCQRQKHLTQTVKTPYVKRPWHYASRQQGWLKRRMHGDIKIGGCMMIHAPASVVLPVCAIISALLGNQHY